MTSLLNRRGVIAACLAGMAGPLLPRGAAAALPAGAEGRMVVNRAGGIAIHSYVSPESQGLVTSHLIETPARLVLVDAQRHPRYGAEVKAYADALGKPVDRLLLSHFHPDHWQGHLAFPGVAVFASALNARTVGQMGPASLQRSGIAGAPPAFAGTLEEGQRIELDGVALEIRLVRDTEAPEIATIGIPAANALILQDILGNRVHPALLHRSFDPWMAEVARLDRAGPPLLLVGHGEPAAPGHFGRLVAYLERARGLFGANTDPVPVIEALRAEFAEFRAPQYLEFIRIAMAPR